MRLVRSAVLGLAAAAVFALPGAARADLLQLRDGRFVDGVKMRVDDQSVVLQYANGEVKVPFRMVEDFVIEGLPPWEPKSDEEKEKRAQGLVPWKGKWVKPEVRDKGLKDELAKRKAAIEEERAHCEWRNRYKWESKNFLWESTLPPAIGKMYEELLETYFEDAKKNWSLKVPKEWGRLKVCLYGSRKEFQQTAGAGGGTLAYYRFVEPRELNCFYDRGNPQLALHCALHEATHYVVDLIDPSSQYPHWVNEAMAEYYGASEVDPKTNTVKPGQVMAMRLTEVRSDLVSGKQFTLAELIGGGDDYEAYTWGWTFVHFMLSTPQYAKKFRQYFLDLAKAKDVQRTRDGFNFQRVSADESLRVFMKRFGLDSLDGLQKEWYAYIEKLDAPGVQGAELAGIDAFQRRAFDLRAPRLLKQAIDGGSTNPQVHICYARCLMYKAAKQRDPEKADGFRKEAVEVIAKAIEICDPLAAELRAERGYQLYALGEKDAGKKLVDLAREMDPSGIYLDIEISEALSEASGSGGGG